jgi:hypothetical protein
MPNKDQLSTVVSAFEHWRSNRSGRQVPTPIALREQAATLLNPEHYLPWNYLDKSLITETKHKKNSDLGLTA